MQKYEKKKKDVYNNKKKKQPMHLLSTTRTAVAAAAVTACLFSGCNKFEGDVDHPAWMHLDSIEVVRADEGENERSNGWYTSAIDAVEVIALMHGDNKERELGIYQLPCHGPVLQDGTADYIILRPVVKQNGIASTRIYYNCMQCDTMYNVTFTPGETTWLGQYDPTTNSSKSLVSYFTNSRIAQLYFEDFEPLATSIRLTESAVEWVKNDPAGARTGSGYALIATADTSTGTHFEILDSLVVTDRDKKNLYLEMDYHTDVALRIGITSRMTDGGNYYSYYAINLYPKEQWSKIYINLGKLWSQLNRYPTFRVIFQTYNPEQIDGHTYIDNLKIINW